MALCSFGCAGAARTAAPATEVALVAAPSGAASKAPAPPVVLRGLGGLEVGMPVAELIRRVGPPSAVSTRDEERETWIQAGYEPDNSVFFVADFREVLSFSAVRLPLFKAFSDGERVLGLKFTLYAADMKPGEAPFGVGGGCVLGAPGSAALRELGEPQVRHVETGASDLEKLEYFDRGLSVAIEDDKIVVFDFFEPPDERTRRLLLDRIRAAEARRTRRPSDR